MKFFVQSLLAAAFFALAATPQAHSQSVTTPWMTSSQLQSYYDSGQPGPGFLPMAVDAGLFNGTVYYFARFERRANTTYATHHGMSDAEFAQRDQTYRAQGYALVHYQRFTQTGVPLNQGVWHR